MTFDPAYSPGILPTWPVGGVSTFKWDPLYTPPLPRFDVPNKRVAVEPFPTTERKAEVRGGVLQPMNQSALTGLKVVFPTTALGEGFLVYVRTRLATSSTYAKEVFEVEGRKFILIPEEEIVLVDRTPVVEQK